MDDPAAIPPQPLLLPPGGTLPRDRPAALLLQAGRLEVYADAAGRRAFLAAIEPNQWVFADPALIIVAPDSAQCQMAPFAALAANPLRLGEAIDALDRWIAALAAGAAAMAPDRPRTRVITPGAAMPAQETVSAEKALVWLPPGPVSLFGLDIPDTESPLPLPASAWASPTAPTTAFSTAQALRTLDWAGGLQRFHAGLASVLAAWRDQADSEDAVRVAAREAGIDSALGDTLRDLGAALSDPARRTRQSRESAAAWALKAAVPGLHVQPAVEADAAGLADLAERCGLHVRKVTLRGDWWRADRGRLLAMRLADGKPVALVPDWRGRYRLRAQDEAPVPVDGAVAASLDPSALSALPPLPARPMTMTWLIAYGLQLCRSDLIVLAGANGAAALLGLVLPWATGVLVNTLVPAELSGDALRLGLALAVVSVGAAGLGLCEALVRTRMDGHLAGVLQAGVLDRALRLPLPVLRSVSSADLALRIMSSEQVRRMVTHAVLDSTLAGLFGLSSLLLLFAYSPAGGLLALGLFVAIVIASGLAGLAQIRALTSGAVMTANLSAMTLQIIRNVTTLRAFGAERRAFVEWMRVATETRARMLRSRFALVRYETGMALTGGLALAAALALLAGAGSSLSLGAYLAFVAAFQGFLGTSSRLGQAVMQIVSTQPVFARSKLILDSPPEFRPDAKPPGILSGGLAFSGVAFAYGPGEPEVLREVSLSIEPGQFVAVTGASGSGKSTLLSLALGLSRPDRGSILYDGQDLAGLDLAAVRRQIGVVRQNGSLLGGSLLENIQGMHDCTLEEAWDAAELAGIAGEIRALPMGMHTVVTEGMAAFSGGQVQRLLLARALAGKPRLLILDEATSALDNVTQALVMRHVAALGVTRLIVAHRLSTIRQADAIHVLHDGRIAESGSFDQLMKANGRFAAYARRQTL